MLDYHNCGGWTRGWGGHEIIPLVSSLCEFVLVCRSTLFRVDFFFLVHEGSEDKDGAPRPSKQTNEQ